jgi:hypothetical protein
VPPAEGVEHLIQELRAGAPEGEVLIDDGQFVKVFYPQLPYLESSPGQAQPAAEAPTATRALIGAVHRLAGDAGLEARIEFRPTSDPFLIEHRLRDKPFLPGVVGLEALAEAASLWRDGKSVIGLRDIEIVNGLMFPNDDPLGTKVTVKPAEGGVRCLFSAEHRDRKGRLIQADRPQLKGIAELGDGPVEIAAPPLEHPPLGWHPFRYAGPGEGMLYHGPPLRRLTECSYQYDGGWGKIVAPALAELAGPRKPEGWILPVAVLDACVVACGSFVFFQFGGRLEVPHRFARLRVARLPRQGETCILRLHFLGREGRHSRFDFTLYGEDETPILQVEGYQTVLIAERTS